MCQITFHVFYSSAIYIQSFFQSRLGRADTAALLLSTSSRHLDGRANDRRQAQAFLYFSKNRT
jgi:hypothetical protein